ncbi:MAG: hypothetical protein Q9160_005623 [Pyrenula sp. 1 TL-2023]
MPTTDDLPLHALKSWQAFRIDALGLVTMLGTEQLNRSVGRLIRNPYFEYLPLLSAFTVSSNQIKDPIPGFSLYNISSAITTNELSAWFSRWLLTQDLRRTGTKLEWTVTEKPRSQWGEECSAIIIAVLLIGPLLALASLSGDWFGLANVLAMIVSVVVRTFVVGQNRNAIDEAACRGRALNPEKAKLLCILPNGKSVIIHASTGVITNCLIIDPKPACPSLYTVMRWIGWIAFTTHVISIGMSTLFVQIYTVILVVVPSVLTVHCVGSNENLIGRCLSVDRDENLKSNPEGRRLRTYIDLELTQEEEAVMLEWNLFPKRCNKAWWKDYYQLRDQSRASRGSWTFSETSTLKEKEIMTHRRKSSESIPIARSRGNSSDGKRSPLPFPATMQP